jgi:hypothetical protein
MRRSPNASNCSRVSLRFDLPGRFHPGQRGRSDRPFCDAPVVGSAFSALVRITRSMATIRAGCDMDEVTGLDRFEPVPDTAWHDVGIT